MPLRPLTVRLRSVFDGTGITEATGALTNLGDIANRVLSTLRIGAVGFGAALFSTTGIILQTVSALKLWETIGERAARSAVEFGHVTGLNAAQAEHLQDALRKAGVTQKEFSNLLQITSDRLLEAGSDADAFAVTLRELKIDPAQAQETELQLERIKTAARPDPRLLAEWKDIFSDLGIALAGQLQPIEERLAQLSNALGDFVGDIANASLGLGPETTPERERRIVREHNLYDASGDFLGGSREAAIQIKEERDRIAAQLTAQVTAYRPAISSDAVLARVLQERQQANERVLRNLIRSEVNDGLERGEIRIPRDY